MALSPEEVRRIASLARLRLTPEEERTFQTQLSAILEHVELLRELDVSGVEPMTHALAAEDAPALREDEARGSLTPGEALANAPARAGGCFEVPRILE